MTAGYRQSEACLIAYVWTMQCMYIYKAIKYKIAHNGWWTIQVWSIFPHWLGCPWMMDDSSLIYISSLVWVSMDDGRFKFALYIFPHWFECPWMMDDSSLLYISSLVWVSMDDGRFKFDLYFLIGLGVHGWWTIQVWYIFPHWFGCPWMMDDSSLIYISSLVWVSMDDGRFKWNSSVHGWWTIQVWSIFPHWFGCPWMMDDSSLIYNPHWFGCPWTMDNSSLIYISSLVWVSMNDGRFEFDLYFLIGLGVHGWWTIRVWSIFPHWFGCPWMMDDSSLIYISSLVWVSYYYFLTGLDFQGPARSTNSYGWGTIVGWWQRSYIRFHFLLSVSNFLWSLLHPNFWVGNLIHKA